MVRAVSILEKLPNVKFLPHSSVGKGLKPEASVIRWFKSGQFTKHAIITYMSKNVNQDWQSQKA